MLPRTDLSQPCDPSAPLHAPRRTVRWGRVLSVVALCAAVVLAAVWLLWPSGDDTPAPDTSETFDVPDWITPAYIDMDGEARSGKPLEEVNDIALHYVGNPGTTAMQNRSYFNQPGVDVCSHFIVGLEGEIVQCLPLEEESVATNYRNRDTISVEVCHPDESGQFTPVTYQAVIRLCTWLCRRYHLTADHLIRHYDVSGKLCPLYYVEHEDAWEQLKTDVAASLIRTGRRSGRDRPLIP